MKIAILAPLAIACLALWAPRIMTSGNAFGGAIAPPDPELCTVKHKVHDCFGPTNCGTIPTTEATNNNAEKLYLPGSTVVNCSYANMACSGSAIKGETGPRVCTPPQ